MMTMMMRKTKMGWINQHQLEGINLVFDLSVSPIIFDSFCLENGARGKAYGGMGDDLSDDDQMPMDGGAGMQDDDDDDLDMEMDPRAGGRGGHSKGNKRGDGQKKQSAAYDDDDDGDF